jgi:hypothetical protein
MAGVVEKLRSLEVELSQVWAPRERVSRVVDVGVGGSQGRDDGSGVATGQVESEGERERERERERESLERERESLKLKRQQYLWSALLLKSLIIMN